MAEILDKPAVIAKCELRGTFGDMIEQGIKPDVVGFCEITQNPIGHQMFLARMTDPEAHATKLLADMRIQ